MTAASRRPRCPRPDAVFGRDYNEALIHQIVIAYQANARSGNRAQKGRADINKSHKKPWAQKGTGRARAGMANSPLWRGGGKIFPNSPDENFTHKVNRKMFRAGIASILSQLVREGRLAVVEDDRARFAQNQAVRAERSRRWASRQRAGHHRQARRQLHMSSRNLPNVLVLEAREVDPVSLVRFENIVLTKRRGQRLEEMLA